MDSLSENIIVPQPKSVGELRDWLTQFGEGNRKHYEKNRVEKGPLETSAHTRMHQQLTQTVSSTSSTASSSRDSIGHLGRHIEELSIQEEEEDEGNEEDEPRQPRPTDELIHDEEGPRLSLDDDSLFQSLDFSDKEEEGTATVGKSDVFSDHREIRQGLKQEEGYRIVSIRKLLETPKPTRRRQSRGNSWDEMLNDEDESDAYSTSYKSTSFLWHRNKSKMNDASFLSNHGQQQDQVEDIDSYSLQGESMSTSSVLVGRRKKVSSDDETDSLSTKSRSSTRSLRSHLPRLLCKSPKEAENTKLVQRTYHNGPMVMQPTPQGTFRPLSPHPMYHSTAFLQSHTTTNSLYENKKRLSYQPRNEESGSVVSCPDFAAASAYLNKFDSSMSHHSNNDVHQQQRVLDRHRRREHRALRSLQQDEVDQDYSYGTSAILPGAVDPSLGQIFSVDDDATTHATKGSTLSNDDYRVRSATAPTRTLATTAVSFSRTHQQEPATTVSSAFENGSRVSETVSRFGGHGRRGGRGRKSVSKVQLRQQELQKQLANHQSFQQVARKVKWQPGNSAGGYKRKVVLDREPSEY